MAITISNSKLTAQLHHKGAELFSLKFKENHKEYIWEGDPKYWGKHSPVLFPIVGTLQNNSYTYNDQKYQLLRHGFARDLAFQVLSQSINEVVFSLKSYEKTKKVYPFEFELQISYTLLENKLVIKYSIINQDSIEIPFSIGAHPAFALPNSFENYSLEFNQQETLKCHTLENDLVSDFAFDIAMKDKKVPLNYRLFENDALIFKTLQSKEIAILENNKPFLKIAFEDFENLGIWTKVNAPFICLEPWLGYSDTIYSKGMISEKEGIQFVKENAKYECQFSIEIL